MSISVDNVFTNGLFEPSDMARTPSSLFAVSLELLYHAARSSLINVLASCEDPFTSSPPPPLPRIWIPV